MQQITFGFHKPVCECDAKLMLIAMPINFRTNMKICKTLFLYDLPDLVYRTQSSTS